MRKFEQRSIGDLLLLSSLDGKTSGGLTVRGTTEGTVIVIGYCLPSRWKERYLLRQPFCELISDGILCACTTSLLNFVIQVKMATPIIIL